MSSEDTFPSYVDLNIFTNCTEKYSDDGFLLGNTLNSIIEIFGTEHINDVRIFVDPEPCPDKLEIYMGKVSDVVPFEHDFVVTDGLADGYIKSTEICQSDYLFQVEHDWRFLPTITHDLGFLVNCMRKTGMEHLRFNKRYNVHAVNENLIEIEVDGCKFCKTTKRSNNPHIIDRVSYLEKWNNIIDTSNTPKRADGIENQMVGLTGYIYGPFNHPTQIFHTDGRS